MKQFIKDWLNRKVDDIKEGHKDSGDWLTNRLIDGMKAAVMDEHNIGYGLQRDRVTGEIKRDERFIKTQVLSNEPSIAIKQLEYNTSGVMGFTEDIIPKEKEVDNDDMFDDVVGFDDVKALLKRAMERKEHVLLVGPPGSAKSMLLEDIAKANPDIATYEDGTDSTKEGILDKIFKNKHLRYLCIDELDKMSMKSKRGLLLLMSANKIKETKLIRTREANVNMTVFAAANYSNMIPKELKDRFFVVKVRDYTEAEFKLVARRVVQSELADYVADKMYHTIGPSVRDLKKINKLCDTVQEVDRTIELMRSE